jgi:2-amino-4-hydroxy-6-hydroxymethyldihydropteridine diphosphokinase
MGAQEPSSGEVRGVIAFIGIGSNMGNPAGACRKAVEQVVQTPGISLIRSSSLYRTEPVGNKEQEWFINAVAEIRTTLTARHLLEALRCIERRMGRTHGLKWGPRIIDLDLLLYGREMHQEEGLVIPHPELHRRAFVLVPFCEIASYVIHPAFGVSMSGLMQRLQDPGRVELYHDANETKGSGRESVA